MDEWKHDKFEEVQKEDKDNKKDSKSTSTVEAATSSTDKDWMVNMVCIWTNCTTVFTLCSHMYSNHNSHNIYAYGIEGLFNSIFAKETLHCSFWYTIWHANITQRRQTQQWFGSKALEADQCWHSIIVFLRHRRGKLC